MQSARCAHQHRNARATARWRNQHTASAFGSDCQSCSHLFTNSAAGVAHAHPDCHSCAHGGCHSYAPPSFARGDADARHCTDGYGYRCHANSAASSAHGNQDSHSHARARAAHGNANTCSGSADPNRRDFHQQNSFYQKD
ncbi:MAG: hypothetical protein FJ316_07660 [SAR202 cluster bacterium]|nr:hypothetical protein [SAR202 cluster bacterium]